MPRSGSRLGKGLGALLDENVDATRAARDHEVSVDAVRANPFQPRGEFDAGRLAELKASIQRNGLLQPILVRPAADGYEIVSGERRFRAIQSLGWGSVPVVLRELNDEQMLVCALVENLQRDDLSVVDEARGYGELIDKFGLTQQEVGDHVGRDRSTVANALRLLQLPEPVLELLERGALSAGHGRAILTLPDPEAQARLAKRVVAGGWSVRETERRARMAGSSPSRGTRKRSRQRETEDLFVRRAERALERGFGTQVRIRTRADGAGAVVVRFHDTEDFLRLAALMGGDELASELRQ